MRTRTRRPIEFYTALPKVELHRHLEGSLRLSTLIEVGREHGLNLAGTDHLRPLVQIGEDEPYTFENFLSKFTTLRLFYRSPEIIGRITREAIEDAAVDNIHYLELRFTPVALSRAEDFPLGEVMDWVINGAREGEESLGVKTRLIVSVNRHESVDLAARVIQLAVDRQSQGIVGVDLAGSEATAPADPFVGLFREARQAGLRVTIHAGEWAGAENVRQAIEDFEAQRVGHGVRVMEDPNIVSLARERGTVFEVCITSNYQSGVVSDLDEHPYPRMIDAGLNVTLNTDDPSISQIVLSNEYRLANEQIGIPLKKIRDQVFSAAQAAFIPQAERDELLNYLRAEYQKKIPDLF